MTNHIKDNAPLLSAIGLKNIIQLKKAYLQKLSR
ncbi:Uncharacterised protein [Rodentibacter pneumotropicus]|uniref:Uncharacterized protein n=1 Tax=Rodentibacter pneumotropicus TaxID=758 RepID=A0A3S5ESC3_9PAST|nr:Uncharacterised protein [Rodentibacter pneumotropicus]